jgi:hypothetical protein
MISYQAPMLPNVDYHKIEQSVAFSLTYLEHGAMQDCYDFLEILKPVLIKEHLTQIPVLLVGYLCAYLGTAATVHTVHQAEKLVLSITHLIKHQAYASYTHFNLHPVNNTIKNKEQKKKNIEILRESAPGSIIGQTMCIGHAIIDMVEEINDHNPSYHKKLHQQKQEGPFCSQETLIKIMLLVSSKKCAEWREQLDGLSDNYIINQLAIQIGWLIGYLSHLENQLPDETQYFEYGLPLIQLYRKYVYKMMESYASAVHEREAKQQESEKLETEALLSEIHSLAEKTNAQRPVAINDFQKQISIAHAIIEKKLIELMMQKYSIKIMLMSLFYFWFTLEAPLHMTDPESIDNKDAFLHMAAVIEIIKNTIRSFPNPKLTPEIKALNEKMQLLKSHLPHPEELDKAPENIEQQTAHINATIHSITSEILKQDIHLEAVAIALFSHWMRLSVFFGVSESDWQKMDYYLSDIMKAVRGYLRSI